MGIGRWRSHMISETALIWDFVKEYGRDCTSFKVSGDHISIPKVPQSATTDIPAAPKYLLASCCLWSSIPNCTNHSSLRIHTLREPVLKHSTWHHYPLTLDTKLTPGLQFHEHSRPITWVDFTYLQIEKLIKYKSLTCFFSNLRIWWSVDSKVCLQFYSLITTLSRLCR